MLLKCLATVWNLESNPWIASRIPMGRIWLDTCCDMAWHSLSPSRRLHCSPICAGSRFEPQIMPVPNSSQLMSADVSCSMPYHVVCRGSTMETSGNHQQYDFRCHRVAFAWLGRPSNKGPGASCFLYENIKNLSELMARVEWRETNESTWKNHGNRHEMVKGDTRTL